MTLAIWTFDMVEQHLIGERTRLPDLVLWENCADDATLEAATERAATLTIRHNRTFIVRTRNADGEWSRISDALYSAGVAATHAAERELAAQRKQYREMRRLANPGRTVR